MSNREAYEILMASYEPQFQIPEITKKGLASAVVAGSIAVSSLNLQPAIAHEVTVAAASPSPEDGTFKDHERQTLKNSNSYEVVSGDHLFEVFDGVIGVPKDRNLAKKQIVELNPEFVAADGDEIFPGDRIDGLRVVQEGETLGSLTEEILPDTTLEKVRHLIAENFAVSNRLPRNENDHPIIKPGDVIFMPAFMALYSGQQYSPEIVTGYAPDAPAAADTLSVGKNATELPKVEIIEPEVLEAPEAPKTETKTKTIVPKIDREADIPARGSAGKSLSEPKKDTAVESDRFEYRDAVSPPNLGEELSNGRFVMPENDEYEFSGPGYPLAALQVGTPIEFREGSLELVQTTYGVAKAWYEQTGTKLIIGDLDAPEFHASHERGVDADLYLPEALYVGGETERDYWLAMLQMTAQYEEVKVVFFSDHSVIKHYNKWAQENDVTMLVGFESGHENHLHVRIEDEYRLDSPSDAILNALPEVEIIESAVEELQPQAELSEAENSMEIARSLLSDSYYDAMENKPTLAQAREKYDYHETRDFGPQYEDTDTALLAYLGGFRGEDLRIAIALSVSPDEGIPGAESSNSPFVVNTSAEDQGFPKGTIAVGPMQMLFNSDWASDPAESIRNPEPNLDPITNYQNALILKERQGWTVGWEAYRHDKHVPNLPKADRLISKMIAVGIDVG